MNDNLHTMVRMLAHRVPAASLTLPPSALAWPRRPAHDGVSPRSLQRIYCVGHQLVWRRRAFPAWQRPVWARPNRPRRPSTRRPSWRMRGRAPQKLFGTGYGSRGLDRSTRYLQLPGARDTRAAFVMEGIAANEVVGHLGLVNNGASGLEMDRIDYALGTPPDPLLLGSSRGHSANAVLAPEDQYFSGAGMNGREDPLVRADIVLITTKTGGAVFSSSSMAWCGSLSHNGYDDNVSRMTGNVLGRFAQDGPVEAID